MKKMSSFILRIFVALLAAQLASQGVKLGVRVYNKHSNYTNLKEEIEKLNRKTPILLDEHTSITEIKVENDDVVYKISTGDFDLNAIDVNLMSKAQKITNLFSICQIEYYKHLLKEGFGVKYDYYALNGQSLFDNQITEQDCSLFFDIDNDSSKIFQHFVDLYSELLPLTLDSETTILDVQRTRNRIVWTHQLVNYSVDELRSMDDPDLSVFKEHISKGLIAKYCIAPDSKLFLENGMPWTATYVDKVGNEVYSFEVDLNACQL